MVRVRAVHDSFDAVEQRAERRGVPEDRRYSPGGLSNDRDGNGKNDYWRGDIAGLYAVKGKDGRDIKLIEISIAGADLRPTTDIEKYLRPYPKAGYRYRALRFADEKAPDPDRFAACAFPDTEKAGRAMFIISHENWMYRKKAVPGGVEIFPADPLKEGWEKMD